MKIAAGTATVEHLQKLYGGEGTLLLTEFLGKTELQGTGRRVGLMTIPSQASIGFHQHQGEYEAYYVLAGEGVYRDNEQEYRIRQGDFVLCKDGGSHGVRNEGAEDLQLFIAILNTHVSA